MTNLFEDKKWTGEFFFPEYFDSRFSGSVAYSPERGIVLSYMLLDRKAFRDSEVLYGVLESGDPCTLFGKLPFPMNSTMRNGVTSRNWKAGFPLMAIGGFLSEDEAVTEIDFTLTTLQEFFYPTGFKNSIKFSSTPLYSVRVPFGLIEVRHVGQFSMLPPEIEAMIFSHKPEAIAALSDAFLQVKADHPEAFFSLKKDIEHRIILKFDQPHSLQNAYQQIRHISNLFSILLYSPVYPESIRFRKPVGDSIASFDLYSSMVIDPRTAELCQSDRSHFHLPLTQATVPLDTVVEEWFADPERYSVIISALQGETGFRDEHGTHGEILLYATQLESISYSQEAVGRKYAYPLEAHAWSRVQQRLKNTFGKSTIEDVGMAISDLRNEIAHVGRPQVWLASLDLGLLVRIANCLQLVVLDHILKQLNVPADARQKFQDAYCPND